VIIYDLKCPDGHRFEGWFKDRDAFAKQQAERLLSCPVCGSAEATVVPSPVAIRARAGPDGAAQPDGRGPATESPQGI